MAVFELEMTDLAHDVKFKDSHNTFQTKLNKDLKTINSDRKIIVEADKITNY